MVMGYHQIELQEKGKVKLHSYEARTFSLQTPSVWDKNSPSNLSKGDEHSTHCVNGITLFVFLDDIVVNGACGGAVG